MGEVTTYGPQRHSIQASGIPNPARREWAERGGVSRAMFITKSLEFSGKYASGSVCSEWRLVPYQSWLPLNWAQAGEGEAVSFATSVADVSFASVHVTARA